MSRIASWPPASAAFASFRARALGQRSLALGGAAAAVVAIAQGWTGLGLLLFVAALLPFVLVGRRAARACPRNLRARRPRAARCGSGAWSRRGRFLVCFLRYPSSS
ncbi:hypothetical protein [Burkholderia gladioli]|uniref:Uncharacterized protein n=1 Tax=Burkholderia gladioli TaxID=28095 RepID=A0AAW3F9U4_BURGA|nr:hypothetical protein [Burkholderia gladioli]AJW99291.1 hypothetical protein BM43_855 [Burkholderia gladioli]ASD80749.1 hypothetical protein CEJ98_18385 [Burkholderia gladioli pv. gladioli]AWY54017.1 hypothetical protein A8H28_22750 [Burkholderia gladioli pv. gladioli]KGC18093.1 hypothetical protein DM48_4790 [Burkholderia gladioli]MBJ9677757.1 hypothetical protein [Burkholderia gladioli]